VDQRADSYLPYGQGAGYERKGHDKWVDEEDEMGTWCECLRNEEEREQRRGTAGKEIDLSFFFLLSICPCRILLLVLLSCYRYSTSSQNS
jgi:hypothetical protein